MNIDSLKIPAFGPSHKKHIMTIYRYATQLRQTLRWQKEHPNDHGVKSHIDRLLFKLASDTPFADEMKREKETMYQRMFSMPPSDEKDVYRRLELPLKKQFNAQYFNTIPTFELPAPTYGIPALWDVRQAIDRAMRPGRTVSLDIETDGLISPAMCRGLMPDHHVGMGKSKIIHDHIYGSVNFGDIERRIFNIMTKKAPKPPSLIASAKRARLAATNERKAIAALERARAAVSRAELALNKAAAENRNATSALTTAVNA